MNLPVFAYWMPGPWELAAVALIVLLLFGTRLPNVMRNLGRSVVEFKKGTQGIDEDAESAETKPASKSGEDQ
jgi:sec-independent protein translocase protein TatA